MQQQSWRASPANPPPSTQPPRVSSIPRPTVMTTFDNPAPAPEPNNPTSAQASTPDAINFYSQRRPVGAPPASATRIPRSVSGPALTTSKSNPVISPAERMQRTSIKDLVAKFNQGSEASPSHPNVYPRKPAPATPTSPDIAPQHVAAQLNRYQRDQPQSAGPSNGFVDPARPRTADSPDSPQPPTTQRPLFGEVVSGAASEWTSPGHGIQYSKPRRGSEGSMHSPGPMFPRTRMSYIEESPVKDPSRNVRDRDDDTPPPQSDASTAQPFTIQRRVPVNPPHPETTNTPDLVTSSAIPSASNPPVTPPTAPSTRYDATPVKSPSSAGQRLNAIISAPVPKESPPLRSSRPRQDITSARSVSPKPNESVRPPNVAPASPERSKLFAGVDMDLAARRNSIRKALREDRERTKYGSSSPPQRLYSRPTNGSPVSPHFPQPAGAMRGTPPRSVAPTNPSPLPQLSSATYSQPAPALKLNVLNMPKPPPDDPASGATQFEEDDSPTLVVPEDFVDHGQSEDRLADQEPPHHSETAVQKRSRTILSQVMEMRRGEASQRLAGSQSSVTASPPLEQDDAGTIQIMLSDTPALNRTSAGWQNRDLHYGSARRRDGPDSTDSDRLIIQDESVSSTPSAQTRESINERQSSSTTLDKDPYSLINKILDQYRESGAVTSEMVQDFQQHILDTDPDFSARDERQSMEIAKAALEDIIKDHSQSTDASSASTSNSFAHDLSRNDEPQWPGAELSADGSGNDTQATAGLTRKWSDAGPTPPPKDSVYNPLISPTADTTLSEDTVTGDGSFHPTLPAENRPVLPEMPSTDGKLSPMPARFSQNASNPDANTTMGRSAPPAKIDSEVELVDATQSLAELSETFSQNTVTVEPPVSRIESHSRGPSLEKEAQMASNTIAQNPEQRRLTQRRHTIKELVDTEYSFNQDMKVIEDIYKGTASSVQSLTPDDQRVLFGNSAQVVEFSEAFLDALKQAARSVYKMPRANQWRVNQNNLSEPNSGSQTEESSLASSEATDDEHDRKTFIGDAFNNYVARMEKVYSEYLKNHDFANQRLSKLQSVPQVQLWLSECHAYANDITSAWDLDSLLVKPVQRILKYPLLLRSLLEQTPADHPDHEALVLAVKQSEGVSHRINESKKRAELLEQVVNKNAKRKDFEFSKVFSRRTDKIAHRVGLSEAVEDPDYKLIAEKFGGRYFQLQIVMRDIEMYKKKTEDFMTQFNQYIVGVEEFIDVGHSNSPEIESKWRKFAVTIREITAIAFADHETAIRRHCIAPMVTLIKLHDGPQRLMLKRKKRIVEYAKYLTVKNRGDRVDRKLQEQGDQFIALNDTLKDELPKLYILTAKLVEACLKNFVDLQLRWHSTWQKKLKNILEEQQVPQDWAEIVETFHSDFSYTEAHVLSLGICNGSLLAETSNFLSSASSFTMADDSSSTKQRPSMGQSRPSPSTGQSEFNRTSSGSLGLAHTSPRSSSESQVHTMNTNGHSPYHPRYRADSNQSGQSSTGWSNSTVGGQRAPPAYNPASYSSQPPQPHRYRHSSDAPSYPAYSPPARAPTNRASDSARPISSSTFYSASSAAHAQRESSSDSSEPRYSGLFSSAMPLSDSPGDNRPQSPNAVAGQREPRVLFTAASMFEFNLDRSRKEAGYPYLNYMAGEIFNVIGEKGELWLARNQDDPTNATGWIWEKHFAKLVTDAV